MVTRNPILTKEERDVLILAAVHPGSKHLSIREIGLRLGIPITRVKTLIHQACVKLGAHNRNEATWLALKRGEIALNELISLDELVEILISVDPNELRRIADRVRHDRIQNALPENGEQIICLDRKQPGLLTNRERDVLILSSQGLTNMEMADKLCMSTSAVRTFLNRAFTKLGARKKADAVQSALKLREITLCEISSLDELTFFLAPLGPDSIEKMAQVLDEKQGKRLISTAS
jgi:DNA-binding CsgD family transcriptional regulator